MPREAPVTSAMREARGLVMISVRPRLCGGFYRRGWPGQARPWRKMTGFFAERALTARFRQQRQLPGLLLDLGLVGEMGRIGAGEAVVGEFWIGGISARLAHRAVHTVDRQERQRV